MTKEELQEVIKNEDVYVIDIREAEEIENIPSITGSVHMPMGRAFVETVKGNLPKDKKVISVCQTGGQCKVITDHMKANGYNADYLEGGLNAWLA